MRLPAADAGPLSLEVRIRPVVAHPAPGTRRPPAHELLADVYCRTPPIDSVVRSRDGRAYTITLPPFDTPCQRVERLLAVTFVFLRAAERRGGLLLHGGLAACGGSGVILTGPPGMGKSTTCARLRRPWRAACDDATLVMPDARGGYRAHPWPTWSRYYFGDPPRTWAVGAGVQLATLATLSRAPRTARLRPPPPVEAIRLLMHSVEEAGWLLLRDKPLPELRRIRTERLETVCRLLQRFPLQCLGISLGHDPHPALGRLLRRRGT